jgi:DnaJ-class molecular chaperone
MKKFLSVNLLDNNQCEGCDGFKEYRHKDDSISKSCKFKTDFNSLSCYTERPGWCPLIDIPILGNDEMLCSFCNGQGFSDNCGPHHIRIECPACKGKTKISITKYYEIRYETIIERLSGIISYLKQS